MAEGRPAVASLKIAAPKHPQQRGFNLTVDSIRLGVHHPPLKKLSDQRQRVAHNIFGRR
jgi:hypothetical protein